MQRFKTRAQFQAALAATTAAKTTHFALHKAELDIHTLQNGISLFLPQGLWIGAMTPKRWAKRAVTRNAIKRQIYTVSRFLQHELPEAAFLVRLRCAFSREEFPSAMSDDLKDAVRNELLVLLRTVCTHQPLISKA